MSRELITIAEARALALSAVNALPSERIAIDGALDRVLAQDVLARGDVPPFACSAMDGYAVMAGASGRTLTVVAESRAGGPSRRSLREGEAIRISTGAAVPEGATAVIRQEDVTRHDDNRIECTAAVAAEANIRRPGEDLRAGSTVLTRGTRLGASELGAAVTAGVGELDCAQRPRVWVLCTGDELRAPGEPLGPGEIHNSNAATLVALATRCGASSAPAQRLVDDRASTESGLATALDRADVVVVSGGISVGPHDHVKPALAALGVSQTFWGVALQPGKPTWFGVKDRQLVFGLPGNPVSAFVTFTLFVAPVLRALQGDATPPSWLDRGAELGVAVKRNPTREQALRVRLSGANGRTIAVPNGPQGSHIISSLLGADALALIPAGEGELPAGAHVLLHELPR